jgi:protein-ribulosamine 3-kinase
MKPDSLSDRETLDRLRRLLGLGHAPGFEPLGAGHGCRHWRLRAGSSSWFVKSAPLARTAVLEAEADGLRALAVQGGPRVPAVPGVVRGATEAFLVMEWLDLRPPPEDGWQRMGEALAALHGVQGRHYGWHRDNWLGATPQPNAGCADWATFWSQRRLGHQLELAQRDGSVRLVELGRRVQERVSRWLGQPPPALLHGDLWSGNIGFTRVGEPAVFDPAVYFGDAEADLAMIGLFGGFPPAFHHAYRAARPCASGESVRGELYALYHVLNHAHLFGGGYRRDAEGRMQRLLAMG